MFGIIFGTACLMGLFVMQRHGFRGGGRGFRHGRGGRLRSLLVALDATPGQEKALRGAIDDLFRAGAEARAASRDVRSGFARAVRDEALDEEALAEAARQWKERIDREFDASVLAGLPDFGPVIERLPQPEIPGHAIYRPWMDPDDEEGAATARVWADLGYAVRVPGYRPLFAESLAALLREQLRWARVESRIDTPEGTRWRVRTGLVGPNGRHAVLVTVWLLRPGGRAPELQQAWPEALPALPPSS